MTYRIRIDEHTEYRCAPDDTLLRAGLRAGLGMPYECNSGSCGACKVELVEGETVANWPAAPGLSERDRARRRVLACQSRPAGDCALKVRLREACRPPVPPRRFRARLAAMRDLTHDLREFRFRVAGAPAFLPGQYALVELVGIPGGERAYSMSNIDDGGGEWHFQVRRVPGGAASAVLFERLAIGDELAVDGPYGLAYLRSDSPRDIVCIGGGSGLSAVLSVARGAAREPSPRTIHFFYGARTPRDVCGAQELAQLPGYGTRIHYTPVVSAPAQDGAAAWPGRTGFVHEAVRDLLGGQLAQLEFYFAGPPAMAQAVQAMLAAAKVPLEQMHYDSFY